MKPKDLRDEFALAVLPDVARKVGDALDKGITFTRDDEEIRPEKYVAGECYSLADAMMAERMLTSSCLEFPEYPECSGDPASCPENEGHGCCGRKV